MIAQADSGPSLNLTQTFVLDELTDVAFQTRSDGDQFSVLTGRSIDSHLAAAHTNGRIEYALTDAINSTVMTVDQSGAVNSQFLYEAFGQTTTTGTFPFQFTGRVPISSSLYYYRARIYNAITGRFISEDPIGLDEGVNLYAYAGNNPVVVRKKYIRPVWIYPSRRNFLQPVFMMQPTKNGCRDDSAIFWDTVALCLKLGLR